MGKILTQTELKELLKKEHFSLIGDAEFVLTGEIDGETLIIKASGEELDFMEGSSFVAELGEKLMDLDHHIILYLEACPYLSSIGIGSLVHISKSCTVNNKKLCIVGSNKQFQELLEMSNLDRVLLMANTIEEAREKIAESE